MGLRGPPKKPTELKLLQGVPGGQSKLNKGEVKPRKLNNTRPPKDLAPDAKKVWRVMAPRLEELGLFTELDINTFRRYCELYARWLQCSEMLRSRNWQTHVPIFHEQTPQELALYAAARTPEERARLGPRLKYLQETPESVEYRRLPAELLRIEQNFGMTPAARAAINIGPVGGKKKDQVRSWLYGRG